MNVQKRLVNTSLKVAKLVIVVGGLFVQQQRPISKAGRILSDISESGLSPQQPISEPYHEDYTCKLLSKSFSAAL